LVVNTRKLFTYDIVSSPAFFNCRFEKMYDREEERKKLKNDRTEKLNRLKNL